MEQDLLTKRLARHRANLISNVKYSLKLNLKKKSKTYEGICKINFNLKKKEEIVINSVSNIKSITLNGLKPKYSQTKYTIILESSNEFQKSNELIIEYSTNYDHNGDGFHQFIDTDKKEYLYSNFEPFDAHLMFPCFDQPDIKAKFNLTVSAPKEWKLISNTYEESISKNKNLQIVKFKETPLISTYVFHLSAGDYEVVQEKFDKFNLRLFFRKSLKKYIPIKDFFKFTKQGLDFYPKYFGTVYPFEKYDQIIVPEFNSLAMENVGAVTFSEALVKRRELIKTERAMLANVVLHEMVHMWFGNLVTMRWWDDLWLNESFADFLAYLGMVKATEFKDGWEDLYQRKDWAYYQDQLPTTHPIASKAKDTKEAFSNFDGISYSKGAAVLKQLMFYMGEENFRKGVKEYFHKHKWSNTELEDFLTPLENNSKIKLKKWFNSWIQTTGVNTIYSNLKVKNNLIKSLEIIQLPSEKNRKLRAHKTNIGLFYKDKILSKQVIYKKKKTKIKEFRNKIVPEFIFPNFQDNDYVKVRFDSKNIDYISNSLDKIKNNLTKQMILGSLWEMVKDSELNPRKLLEILLKFVKIEKNLNTLESMINTIMLLQERYFTEIEYKNNSEEIHKLSIEKLKEKLSNDENNLWFGLLLQSYKGYSDINEIESILNSKIKFSNLQIDQDKRWTLITRLALHNHPKIKSLLKKEYQKDKTDSGKKGLLKAEATIIQNKQKYWNLMTKKSKLSFDDQKNIMTAFNWRIQKNQLLKYSKEFFKKSIKVFEENSQEYGKFYSSYLYPSYNANPELITYAKSFIKQNPSMPKLLKKYLIERISESEKTIKSRNKFG